MRLTKKDIRKYALKAAELIETEQEIWSCWALDDAQLGEKSIFTTETQLSRAYEKFYEPMRSPEGVWAGLKYDRSQKDQRIIMLLLFAYTGGKL